MHKHICGRQMDREKETEVEGYMTICPQSTRLFFLPSLFSSI